MKWVKILLLCVGCTTMIWGSDFDKKMGKGTTAWNAIRTPEDRNRLEIIKHLYERYQTSALEVSAIPKILHWVWLGPEVIPALFKDNMRKWIDFHPDWTFKFWTDQQWDIPFEQVEICNGEEFLENGPADYLECYFDADNFRERSELLRLAILNKEGGIYIDGDMRPVKALDPLSDTLHFFCGLEMLGSTVLSSSVYLGTNLIGTVPQHPVIARALEWLMENWERLERQFPVTDQSSLIYRVKHRAARALDKGFFLVQEEKIVESDCIVVFPSAFFNQLDPEKAEFAVHQHAHSWLPQEASAQWNATIQSVEKKIALPWITLLMLGVVNLGLYVVLIRSFRKRSRA